MKIVYCETARSCGRTSAIVELMRKCFNFTTVVRIPCVDIGHARRLKSRLINDGFKVSIRAAVQTGVLRQPHKSRRTVWLDVEGLEEQLEEPKP